MTRLAEWANEYGTPVAEYRCKTCGELYTICPAPETKFDPLYENCTAPECASYDPDRDINKWFENGGMVRSIPTPDGKMRLVPYRVIEGGKP